MKISLLVLKKHLEGVFAEKYFERIRKHGDVFLWDEENFEDRAKVLDFVKDSDIIITSWHSPVIDKEILDACPNLQAVLHAAGSIKPIMSDELASREDIRLTASAAAIGEGVAETALGFAIAACKGAFTMPRYTRAGEWNAHNASEVIDFYDIKVGIISAGFVGRHMIKLLRNFHVDILVYDPTMSAEQIRELGAEKRELNEFLSECDVISVHAPKIPATEHMINRDNIELLKDRVIIVNTARGSIFDEPYLIERLKEKKGMFACLDITEVEPPAADNELRFLDNVNLTPHLAGTASNGRRRIALHVCEELDRFMAGEKMKTEIDRSMLSKMA
ncbi:MAG: hydroxyacid dehydrogenase [Oscillospiraceae bacterium]|nr:hydroxyacid dehydrogenase [Oscillospiraceae bacterium]